VGQIGRHVYLRCSRFGLSTRFDLYTRENGPTGRHARRKHGSGRALQFQDAPWPEWAIDHDSAQAGKVLHSPRSRAMIMGRSHGLRVGQGKSDGAGAFPIVAEAIGQFRSGMAPHGNIGNVSSGSGVFQLALLIKGCRLH
jgi:hypothetical protein